MILLQMSFLFQGEAFHGFLCHVLLSVMVFSFCFQVPMWLPCSTMEAQLLGFARLQLFGLYPWQAYVPLSDGLWPTRLVHCMPLLSLLQVGRSFMLLLQVYHSHSTSIMGHKALRLSRVILSLCLSCMTGRDITWSTPNLW